MTVRIYRSTDASAPTLTGVAGSLTTLLDAILVNGYGSQTAAGWTIGFTTTNKRGYLQNLTGANNSSGMYLYVDDTAPGAGGAQEARACGFETMSAITPVGTGQFPTSGQTGIGVGTLVIRKSATANATTRVWTAIADGHTLYFFAETGDQTTPVAAFPFVFGDFFPTKAADPYAVGIIGRIGENNATPAWDPMHAIGVGTVTVLNPFVTCVGCYIARSWTGLGGSVQFGKSTDIAKSGIYSNSTGGQAPTGNIIAGGIAMGRTLLTPFPYPNGPDGACWVSPIWVQHSGSIRGIFKGLWAPLHDRPLNHADTYSVSSGNLNGKSFIAQMIPAVITGSAADQGQVHIETSDTWTSP